MRGKKATTEQIIAVLKEAAAGPRFRRVAAPTPAGIEALLGQIDTRIARHLERRGLRVRDVEGSYLSTGPERKMAWPPWSGTRSPTVSRWERARGARRSGCRPSPRRWKRLPGMSGWRSTPGCSCGISLCRTPAGRTGAVRALRGVG